MDSSIKVMYNDMKIKNINSAEWIKTMNQIPKTVGHMKLLITIVDKIGIFKEFDINKTSEMDSNKLNILYAILRIMNKVFNKYLDYVDKKIFMEKFKNIFPSTDLINHQLLLDQITQDIDHFVCSIFKNFYPNLNHHLILINLKKYITNTFKKSFYQNTMKKLGYIIDDSFFDKHKKIIDEMVDDFVSYTNQELRETYQTMRLFLVNIFNNNSSREMILDIMKSLEKHIDLRDLFKEDCLEIQIYSEQKIDDELEIDDRNNHKKINTNTNFNSNSNNVHVKESDTYIQQDYSKIEMKEMNKNKNINYDMLKYIGYQIYNDNSGNYNTPLSPFIEHKLMFSENDMIKILSYILKNYRNQSAILDINSNITLEDYYSLTMSMKFSSFDTYDNFCASFKNINTCNNVYYNYDIIFRLVSRIFNIKIELYHNDFSMDTINNTLGNKINGTVVIYQPSEHEYYNLYHNNKTFVPIFKKVFTVDETINNFKNMIKMFCNSNKCMQKFN